jgi:hypothetical protein
MPEILQNLLHFILGQPPFIQGIIIGLLVTGVPGPLNLIAVYKTIYGHTKSALRIGLSFAFWFTFVAFIFVLINFTFIDFDIILWMEKIFIAHKKMVLYIGAFVALCVAIFFFVKKADIPHFKHSEGMIQGSLFVGIVLFPGNWIVFTASYATIKSNGHVQSAFEAMATLPGVFASCFFIWLVTIAFAMAARKWILMKSHGDKAILSRLVNRLIGTLILILAVILLLLA